MANTSTDIVHISSAQQMHPDTQRCENAKTQTHTHSIATCKSNDSFVCDNDGPTQLFTLVPERVGVGFGSRCGDIATVAYKLCVRVCQCRYAHTHVGMIDIIHCTRVDRSGILSVRERIPSTGPMVFAQVLAHQQTDDDGDAFARVRTSDPYMTHPVVLVPNPKIVRNERGATE